jgi:SAM-dependent methyltransferase
MLASIKKHLLLVRLYTVINIIIVSILPTILLNRQIDLFTARDIIIGILFWTAIILGKEVMHENTDHREKINKKVPVFLGLILVLVVVFFQPISIIFLALALITFFAYSLKNKNWILAPFSFVFRGFLEVLILITIFSFYVPIPQVLEKYSLISLLILLITDSRNLIGDIRDVSKDQYTFPKIFGIRLAKILAILLLTPALIYFKITIVIPLIVISLLIIFLKDNYLLHKIYVQATGFFILNLISETLFGNTFISNLGFFIVIFNNSYEYTPREVARETQKSQVTFTHFEDGATLLFKSITDPRFRKDLKALIIAKKGYSQYAWQVLEDLGVSDLLKEGSEIKTIMRKTKIKNELLLEYLLDLLTGENVLNHNDGKYILVQQPKKLDSVELNYMKENYPASFEWTFSMIPKAKITLKSGKKSFDSSFDETKSALLWDKLMQESPYSFRKIAIRSFIKKIKPNDKIIDIGCGTGASLISILEEAKAPIYLSGTDPSAKSIDIAKQKVKNLIESEKNPLKKDNLIKTNLFVQNLLNKPLTEKYNFIFMSFILNHIPREKRKEFYKRLYDSLEPDGTCIIYQLVSKSKFERTPMWVMHNVPSHQDFPILEEYVKDLEDIFPKVKVSFNGLITILKK